jgi:hypothetical protein
MVPFQAEAYFRGMDPHDLPALAANLARHVGMPPPPVVVVGLRDGTYACFAKRQGAWALRVDPRTTALPGPVTDGYLAHPLVAASLGQPRRLLRRVRAVTWLAAAAGLGLVLKGVPLGWTLLAILPPAWLLITVVHLVTARQHVLGADRRTAELFGPGFLLPFLEHVQANPPRLNWLARLLMRAVPTPAQRQARLDHRSGRPTPR